MNDEVIKNRRSAYNKAYFAKKKAEQIAFDVTHMRQFIIDTIEPITESGCWVWPRCYDTGYGYMSVNGKRAIAHRVSYMAFKGEIPPNLQIDHLCRVRCCVNPYHLEAVTQKTNLRRGHGLPGLNIRKTHCPAGHLYSDGNLYVYPSTGHRKCLECQRVNANRRYNADKELGRKRKYWDRKEAVQKYRSTAEYKEWRREYDKKHYRTKRSK